jgi:hypothetical protein
MEPVIVALEPFAGVLRMSRALKLMSSSSTTLAQFHIPTGFTRARRAARAASGVRCPDQSNEDSVPDCTKILLCVSLASLASPDQLASIFDNYTKRCVSCITWQITNVRLQRLTLE